LLRKRHSHPRSRADGLAWLLGPRSQTTKACNVSAAIALSEAKSPEHVDNLLLVVYRAGSKEVFRLEDVAFTLGGWHGCC
jgi:hypothetical protein